MRTALRDNATAYGFSLSITAAYGLASALRGPGGALETVLFALGAAGAFVLLSVCFLGRFRRSPLNEGDQVLTLSGGFDFVSVAVAVSVAFGLAHLPEPWARPLTGLGTVMAYLLVAGLDVVLSRLLSRRTSFGRPREERGSRGPAAGEDGRAGE
ncbi:hypothetical protein RM572_22545 [Streptomyces sp. DSM 42041]|uniref:Cation transporter n=1 Tax=Streptomyces hazeniae TaxID=3075538 RepID=A0ABU2P006_9ACTN|nr:hypothetical protein [Streptomyces sp. DSM 42041]MDT0381542.1 hypothetical protein [Streptomyces sp. DSM 42041]